jgi:hypothetical protein
LVRAGRLVDMLLTLQRRGRLTAAQLAEHLEVSVRTVLRDVDALGGAGVPIYSIPGVGGGIDLVEGFRTRLTGLTAPEAAAVFLAGQPTIAHRLGLGVDAAGARRKLLEALPVETRIAAESVDRWFLHDPDPWPSHRIPHGELRRVAQAIERRIEVELTFADRNVSVKPLGLVLKAGEWHLVVVGPIDLGGDAELEVVMIDYLRATRLTRRTFAVAEGFELARFWEQWVAGAGAGDETVSDFERSPSPRFAQGGSIRPHYGDIGFDLIGGAPA